MNWIGIDPGLDGAIAVICDGGITLLDTPTISSGKKRDMDLYAIVRLLKGFTCSQDALVSIEAVHSMPGKGVSSTFAFGKGFGMWLGILAALSIPHQAVTPQRWKGIMLRDGGKEKDAARVKAMQLFPQIADQISRKRDHGRADALLIAAWAQGIVNASRTTITGTETALPAFGDVQTPLHVHTELERGNSHVELR